LSMLSNRLGQTVLLLALFLALSFFITSWLEVQVVDDSYIGIRYAWQLVQGHGLVFNVGERVEGYSNLLWVLLMAVPLAFHWPVESFGVVAGILFGGAAFFVAHLCATRAFGVRPLISLVTLFLCMLNTPFWISTTGGLEFGMYSLLLVLSYYMVALSRPLLSGLGLAILPLVRPEAAALAPLTAALQLFRQRRATPRRSLVALLAPWFVVLGTATLWRLWYYGELIPNTVIAKHIPLQLDAAVSGVRYVAGFLGTFTVPVLAASLAGFNKKLTPAYLAASLWFAFQCIVSFRNGGDWMPGFRLLVCYLPILSALAAAGVQWIWESTGYSVATRRIVVGGLFFFVLFLQGAQPAWKIHPSAPFRPSFDAWFTEYDNTAKALAGAIGPHDVVSPEAIGLIGYRLPSVYIHDFSGLTDKYVARHGTTFYATFGKSDYAYTVNQVAPALIVTHSADSHLHEMDADSHGALSRNYLYYRDAQNPDFWFTFRRDRAEVLLAGFAKSPIRLEPMSALVAKRPHD